MDDRLAVEATDDRFIAALNAMFAGDDTAMKAIWSHGDDVIYLGPEPGLFHVGWPKIVADWDKQAHVKLGGQIELSRRHVMLGSDKAAVHLVVTGQNRDQSGKLIEVSMWGTNVYRKEDGAWKLAAHHSDPLPFLDF